MNLADPNGRDAIVRSGLHDEEWLRANTPSGNSATPSLVPAAMANDPCYQDYINAVRPNVLASNDPNDWKKNPPPEDVGYKPPKRKGPNVPVRVPNSNDKGWEDKNGDIWVPTPGMDGGDGWTVQQPNGGHRHVYPDGHVRTHDSGVYSPSLDFDWNSILIFVATCATFIGGAAIFAETGDPSFMQEAFG